MDDTNTDTNPDLLALTIDGDELDDDNYGTFDVQTSHHDEGATITVGNEEFIVFPDGKTAGLEARQYWDDMAQNDPTEFRCMVGDETLIAWAMGQPAGPGTTKVTSLDKWLDLWKDTPEDHFAGYDGGEREVEKVSKALIEELGFTPTVAYRSN